MTQVVERRVSFLFLVGIVIVGMLSSCDDDSAFASDMERTEVSNLGREAAEALGGVIPLPAQLPRQRLGWKNPPLPEVFPEAEVPVSESASPNEYSESCRWFELMTKVGDECG